MWWVLTLYLAGIPISGGAYRLMLGDGGHIIHADVFLRNMLLWPVMLPTALVLYFLGY